MRNFARFLGGLTLAFSVTSQTRADEPFFSLEEIESVEIMHLWHMLDADTLVHKSEEMNESTRIQVWRIDPTGMHKNVYSASNQKPVAIILLARNHVNATPVGFLIFARERSSVPLIKVGPPRDAQNVSEVNSAQVLFTVRLQQSDCDKCEEGWILFSKDRNGSFIPETKNVGIIEPL